jgi:hypothetical protein
MENKESQHIAVNEQRRSPRFVLENEANIRSSNGLMPARTLEISKSGSSAILPAELPLGEVVELNIKLAIGVATTQAVVKNRNVFRHGFEFLQPLHDVVGHETALAGCPSCGGTGLIIEIADGGQGVAFIRTRCPDCNDSARKG